MFHGMCTDSYPDYCNNMMSCVGSMKVVGDNAVLGKLMEATKGKDTCFDRAGSTTFILTGNQTALEVSEFTNIDSNVMGGTLTPCFTS